MVGESHQAHGMQVEIMMALEEQFNISLSQDGNEKIVTVQDAADLIHDVRLKTPGA